MTENSAGITLVNEEPWPRKFACYGYANMEIRADHGAESTEWWLDACNRVCEDAGVKLADGELWDVTWSQITQQEIDLENSARASEGLETTWMRAGDWHYRAIAKVVPI